MFHIAGTFPWMTQFMSRMEPTWTLGTWFEHSNQDRKRSMKGRQLGLLLAALCTTALVGLLWFRGDYAMLARDAADTTAAPTLTQGPMQNVSASAPMAGTSVPNAAEVFASRPYRPEDEAPAPPTF